MGWWGYGITDGDAPADIQDQLIDDLGLYDVREQVYEARTDSELEALSAKFESEMAEKIKILDAQAYIAENERDDGNLMVQVIAFMHLRYGVPLSEWLKSKAIEVTKDEIEGDLSNWQDPEARRSELQKFVKAIENNDRKGLVISTLFAVGELTGLNEDQK